MNSPLFYKPKEVCSILGVETSTIYAMLYRGDIPGAFQIGRSWYINKKVLQKYLDNLSTSRPKTRSINLDPNSDRHGIAT